MLDTSFNSELIVLKMEDFQYLVTEVYGLEEVNSILAEARKLVNDTSKTIQLKDVLGWVVQGAVGGITSGLTSAVITDLTPNGIINTIKKIFKQ